MQKSSFIGIDFGTTNTAVVRLRNDEQGFRNDILGEEGEYPFSSIVAIPKNGGALKFGREVKNHREALSSHYEIFTSMKSYLGTDREFIVGSNRYSATEITAEFLKSVKAYIASVHKTEIKEAGLSFPVDFTPEARHELRIAAESAGIAVKCFISEPTAAYFANRREGQVYSRVMVLDWGGGTFDISILNLKKNSVTEAAVFGEKIGGDDIDIELAKRIHADIVKKSNSGIHIPFDDMNPTSRDLMMARCERAKIEISETYEDYAFSVKDYGDYGTKSLTISVDLFNGIVEPIIKARILRAIDSALGRANLTPSGIDAVVIVGGSSNLAPYEKAITRLFGEDKIILPRKPQWSTAEGAALMQIIGGSFKLNDSLGVFLSDGSVLPLLKSTEDGVGTKAGPISFSLVEDARDAHFVFTNGDGNIVFKRVNVPTKGFLNEVIKLTAEIGDDQIARIEINNSSMGNSASNPPRKVEINKLTFYYDISVLN
jgi:molecular chaperone DnaK